MIKKYSMQILTVIAFLMAILTITIGNAATYQQKAITILLLLLTLHEWEENKYPGGFLTLMCKTLQIDYAKVDAEFNHMVVEIFILSFTLIPFILNQYIFLLFVPVSLGIFEVFAHILGFFVFHMKKPYSPGLITAFALGVCSFIICYQALQINLATVKDIVIGFVVMLIGYLIMRRILITNVKNK